MKQCVNDCKLCPNCSVEFAEQGNNIVYDLVCNKYGNIAEHFTELLKMKGDK